MRRGRTGSRKRTWAAAGRTCPRPSPTPRSRPEARRPSSALERERLHAVGRRLGALSWNVVDAGPDNWGADVTSLTLAGTIHIKPWPSDPTHEAVPNTANPVDGNINNTGGSSNHWQAAIDDMANYDTAGGGAGPNWHSTAASIAHETAHWTGTTARDAVTSAAGGNWSGANADLDALREPKAHSATSADARTALQPRVAARLATWRATVGRGTR